MIIDAWMQHPNPAWIGNPMFESLRRWRPGKWSETAPPIEDTLAEMDSAGVSVGMLCGWHGPGGPMISNDEVAQHCRAHPGRFVGIASVDLFRPMDAVRELRLRQGTSRSTLGVGAVAGRSPVLSSVRSISRSARRSDTRGRCANPNRGAPSPISIASRSSFRNFAFSAAISACRGSTRCCRSS
jgi:hypothetical protein